MISTEITRIQGAKTAIKTAIEGKDVTVPSSTKIDGMAAYINKIDNNRMDKAVEKDVIYIDFDGTILYSYTAAEFALLTEHPTNYCEEENMTAVGWNWTLADAKTYVSTYGGLVIGQECVTTDGKTHIWINLTEEYHEPYVGLGVNGTVTINWGEGYEESTLTGTSLTTAKFAKSPYTHGGYYHITVTRVSGNGYRIIGGNYSSYICCGTNSNNTINRVYAQNVYKVRIGNYCGTHSYAFTFCANLKSVNIPLITSKTYVFFKTSDLGAMVLPSDMDVPAGNNTFYHCTSLRFLSLPKSFGDAGTNTLVNDYKLSRLHLVPSTTSYSTQSFSSLSSLKSIVIPAEVTALGTYAFYYNYSLRKIKFLSSTPPTAGTYSFSNLPTTCVISVPQGSLSAYTSADNYPDSATYTYIEE